MTRGHAAPGLLQLPPELLVIILQNAFPSTKERLEVVPVICSQLLALSPALHTSLELRIATTPGRATTGRFSDLLKRLAVLGRETRRLELVLGSKCFGSWQGFNLPRLLGALPCLEALALARSWQKQPARSVLSAAELHELGRACPRLRELRLNPLAADGFALSAHSLAGFPALTGLSVLVRHGGSIWAEFDADFDLQSLQLLTRVVHLGLVLAIGKLSEGAVKPPEHLGTLAGLKHLELEVLNYYHYSWLHTFPSPLLSLAPNCLPCGLSRLELRVTAWEEALPGLQTLTHLRSLSLALSNCGVGVWQASQWGFASALTELSVTGVDPAESGAVVRHQGLLSLPLLRRMTLAGCHAFGAVIAWDSLSLSLTYCDLRALSPKVACVDLRACTGLRDLVLDNTWDSLARCCAASLTGLALGETDVVQLPAELGQASGLRSLQLLKNKGLAIDSRFVDAVRPLQALRWFKVCVCSCDADSQQLVKDPEEQEAALRAALPALPANVQILHSCLHSGRRASNSCPGIVTASKCLRPSREPLPRVLRSHEVQLRGGSIPRDTGPWVVL